MQNKHYIFGISTCYHFVYWQVVSVFLKKKMANSIPLEQIFYLDYYISFSQAIDYILVMHIQIKSLLLLQTFVIDNQMLHLLSTIVHKGMLQFLPLMVGTFTPRPTFAATSMQVVKYLQMLNMKVFLMRRMKQRLVSVDHHGLIRESRGHETISPKSPMFMRTHKQYPTIVGKALVFIPSSKERLF